MVLLTSDRFTISATTKILLLLYSLILKLFSKKISGIFKLLLTIYKVSLEKTSNIS